MMQNNEVFFVSNMRIELPKKALFLSNKITLDFTPQNSD